MFGAKVRINPVVLEQARKAAQALGCASVEEYIEQLVERDARRVLNADSTTGEQDQEAQAIAEKLKGLGYLD